MLACSHSNSEIKVINKTARNTEHRAAETPTRKYALNRDWLVPTPGRIYRFVIYSLHELVNRLAGYTGLMKDTIVDPHQHIRIRIGVARLHQPRCLLVIDGMIQKRVLVGIIAS